MTFKLQISAELEKKVIREVRMAERLAYASEKTMINITGLLDYITEHPDRFEILPAQSLKHRKALISQVLTHIQKYRPYSTKTRHGGGRAFIRPEGYQNSSNRARAHQGPRRCRLDTI
jgi:hypothetical protein